MATYALSKLFESRGPVGHHIGGNQVQRHVEDAGEAVEEHVAHLRLAQPFGRTVLKQALAPICLETFDPQVRWKLLLTFRTFQEKDSGHGPIEQSLLSIFTRESQPMPALNRRRNCLTA